MSSLLRSVSMRTGSGPVGGAVGVADGEAVPEAGGEADGPVGAPDEPQALTTRTSTVKTAARPPMKSGRGGRWVMS